MKCTRQLSLDCCFYEWLYYILAILFMLFGFLATNVFYIMWLSNSLGLRVPDEGYSRNLVCVLNLISTFYYLNRTWWRLFWTYPMKAILNVPDEGYSERTWWRLFWTYLMKAILKVPDEGYSERTWWRLFWTYLMKVILNVPDEGYSERTRWRLFWTYLMKVILNVPDEGYSERTWWRLFQKLVVRTKFDIYVFINNSEHRKMRAKQQHVCKEMNQYMINTNRKWILSFGIEWTIGLKYMK
jgi:hypothetical protein